MQVEGVQIVRSDPQGEEEVVVMMTSLLPWRSYVKVDVDQSCSVRMCKEGEDRQIQI
jgi:hypothetical protein